jgi:hypothetical protein
MFVLVNTALGLRGAEFIGFVELLEFGGFVEFVEIGGDSLRDTETDRD